MSSLSVILGRESLELLPEGATWWPSRSALMVADLHLGKAGVFRRAGLAIPEGDTRATLERLTALIRQHRPSRVYLLGDIVHASPARDPALRQAISDWRAGHAAVTMVAVLGNHDRQITALRRCFDWQPEPFEAGGLWLHHHPPGAASPQGPWLAGHWHPVVKLRAGGDQLRLPAFVMPSDQGLILPAFGGLTGGHPVAPRPGQRRYPCSGQRVFLLDESSGAAR